MLHRHGPTNGAKGVHEQQTFAESKLLVLGRESVRSLISGSQSAPQADVYAEVQVRWLMLRNNVWSLGHSWAFSVVED